MEIFLFICLAVDGRYLTSISALKKKKRNQADVEHKIQAKRKTLLSLLSIPSVIKTHVNNFTSFTLKKKSSLLVQLNEVTT